VGGDHFHDFIREAVGRSMRGGCLRRRIAELVIDVGFASTPGNPHATREVYPYGANGVGVRGVYVSQWATVPDTKDIGPLERPAFKVVEAIVVVVAGTSRLAFVATHVAHLRSPWVLNFSTVRGEHWNCHTT
jgi:hypothetical protein